MVNKSFSTWEDAVSWLISQPDKKELVYNCYYDQPPINAAIRFWKSEEWLAVKEIIANRCGKVLDIGAGHGISTFALAKDDWDVTALEPNGSNLVGTGAIRKLTSNNNLSVNIIENKGEGLPFEDNTFDFVYARQVLHHSENLNKLCAEVYRVLKPNGLFLASRDHVITSEKELPVFLEQHPLHHIYGGENAYTLYKYKHAIKSAGFNDIKVIKSFDSVINYYPYTKYTLKEELRNRFIKYPSGALIAKVLLSDMSFNTFLKVLSFIDRRPGRAYSFIMTKV